jgi:hypothetical protein
MPTDLITLKIYVKSLHVRLGHMSATVLALISAREPKETGEVEFPGLRLRIGRRPRHFAVAPMSRITFPNTGVC